MTTIKLNRDWELGGKFDEGGFGDIYEATADDGSPAVVKLIPKEPGAERELLFEDLSGLPNVLPILDSGEWENSYVIVMPKAEKSLKEHLEENGGRLDSDEAMRVLTDVATALASLEADVVHRDLKPGNILLFDGHWCLADFGIARYAEATTAPDTHKYSMTPPYAAPEQWRAERATNATDMYAFGVIAFELTQGELPFNGPDFRQQHLENTSPALAGCPSGLASLITECLYKASAARPTAANIRARLLVAEAAPSASAARLQEVQRAVAERRAQEAARQSAEQLRDETRQGLFEVANGSLTPVVEALRQRILELAPATEIVSSDRVVLRLDKGALTIDPVEVAPAGRLGEEGYDPPFEVIAYSAIAARMPRDQSNYQGRSHSLWFCDAHDEGVYRWYELGFMSRSLMGGPFTLIPAAFDPTTANARGALSPAMGVCQIAWEPVPFDQGEEDQFIERWLGWFAEAADGSISLPRHMPEDSGGHHRRA